MAKILKSTLIGGFRKKDVIEYLEELNLERQKEQAEQAKENQALADTIAEQHARLQNQEEILAETQADLEAARSEAEVLTGKLETAAAALEESKTALEQQLTARQALENELEEKTACIAGLEETNIGLEARAAELAEKVAALEQAESALRDRLAAAEGDRAAQQTNLQAMAARLSELEAEKEALTQENEKLRRPAETAKRVVEAVPDLVRTAVDAVPDSVKENLVETAETARRKVVAIHRRVSEWSRKEQEEEPQVTDEDILVDSEMAPEQPAPEYKAQTEPMTPEALLEKCRTRLGEVAREFNDLYQAVVRLEDKEQQKPAPAKSKLGHLSSIKEILDRVRSLGEKK